MAESFEGPTIDGVTSVTRCRLIATDRTWAYAADNTAAIERHWRRRLDQTPTFFNGTVYLLDRARQTDDAFQGEFLTTDFKSYLYWREAGFPEAGVRDCFGSALLRSADGAILLGTQRAGNLNSGQSYLPGGFIDVKDRHPDGSIDIEKSILRELAEETGLATEDLTVRPGYRLARSGPLLSISVEIHASANAQDLARNIEAAIAADPKSELQAVTFVRDVGALNALVVPAFARALMSVLLPKPNMR